MIPWQQAWQQALYGPDGFFTAGDGPAAHFRTAVHAAAAPLAGALLELARRHGCTAVVDVGAGRGELLGALAALPDAAGLRLHGVDVVARPGLLPPRVGWSNGLDPAAVGALPGALVVAWELLDDIPCPVLELDDDGVPRVVLVEPGTGRERLGDPAGDDDLAWCRRWWPLDAAEPGDRVEVGRPREEFWADLVRRAADGGARLLLAVDYAHERSQRPGTGTLTGFRRGRAVPPVPDRGCDLTAHVALDAVQAAGTAAGAVHSRLTDHRTALVELGLGRTGTTGAGAGAGATEVSAGSQAWARSWLERAVDRSPVTELLDPGSLGGFGWLLQSLGADAGDGGVG